MLEERKLRIVFMGTPEFAVGILDALKKQNHSIVGVVTAPDKPAGRGRKMNESAVKKYAIAHGLHVMQPANLKAAAFVKMLKDLRPTLQIVVAFRMLPKVVWQIPTFGTFNLHASLLPQYRGAAPINWAIINGAKETGVTTFFIDEKIDTGDMILQKDIVISEHEDAGQLHDRLLDLGKQAVLQTVELIAEGPVKTIKQIASNGLKLAHKLDRTTCKINWDDSLDSVYNHIRGLSPYPAAWATLETNNEVYTTKFFVVEKQVQQHTFKNGAVIFDKKDMKIAVPGGYIGVKELQLQGKRRMDVVSFLNGMSMSENSFFV